MAKAKHLTTLYSNLQEKNMTKPYQGTSVNWAKSQTAIVKLLNSKGIFETRFTNLSDKFALEFRITDNKKMLFKVGIASGIGVRILVPFIGSTDENKREREKPLG